MTDHSYYEAPEHVWGPLWRFANTHGVYILTPTGRLLRLHVWACWYLWFKWEQRGWLGRQRQRRGDATD